MRGSTGGIGTMLKSATTWFCMLHVGIAVFHDGNPRCAHAGTYDAHHRASRPAMTARRVEQENETDTDARGRCRNQASDRKGHTMLRHVMIGLAAATLVGAMLIPDDASARGGRGGGARVGAGGGRAHVSRPIARPGVGYGRYAGYRRGVGWGAAAVGAAAVGAAGYYGGYYGNSNSCYRDAYGQLICPDQYQNQYRY
jgi:hypothetical protein